MHFIELPPDILLSILEFADLPTISSVSKVNSHLREVGLSEHVFDVLYSQDFGCFHHEDAPKAGTWIEKYKIRHRQSRRIRDALQDLGEKLTAAAAASSPVARMLELLAMLRGAAVPGLEIQPRQLRQLLPTPTQEHLQEEPPSLGSSAGWTNILSGLKLLILYIDKEHKQTLEGFERIYPAAEQLLDRLTSWIKYLHKLPLELQMHLLRALSTLCVASSSLARRIRDSCASDLQQALAHHPDASTAVELEAAMLFANMYSAEKMHQRDYTTQYRDVRTELPSCKWHGYYYYGQGNHTDGTMKMQATFTNPTTTTTTATSSSSSSSSSIYHDDDDDDDNNNSNSSSSESPNTDERRVSVRMDLTYDPCGTPAYYRGFVTLPPKISSSSSSSNGDDDGDGDDDEKNRISDEDSFSISDYGIEMNKYYLSSHSWLYWGHVDKRGIVGAWGHTRNSISGSFRLFPCVERQEQEEEEEEEEEDEEEEEGHEEEEEEEELEDIFFGDFDYNYHEDD